MGVDYTARKAAKKARKAEGRTSVGKRSERRGSDRDRDAGDGDKKSKRDRPKYGRRGARRMCKGMCYGAAPMLNDDDLEWGPDDHVAPQLLVPKPSAATMAAAAAGAATLRSVAAAAAAPRGGPPGKGKAARRALETAPAEAPASPEPSAVKRRFSTGVGSLAVNNDGAAAAATPQRVQKKPKATTLSPADASHLASRLTPRYTALAKAGGAWPPTAVQAGVWAATCTGRDARAVAAPGAGKTLAYAVPAAAAAAAAAAAVEKKASSPSPSSACRPTAVILVPARELATQVAAVCTGLRRGGGTGAGVKTGLVVGGVDKAAQGAAIRGAAILVATPGRLLDLVDDGGVDLGHVALVAVDEADKLLSPGLAPQLDRLRDLLLGPEGGRLPGRTVILASATMPAAVDAAADAWLSPDRADVVIKGGGGGQGGEGGGGDADADADADADDDDALPTAAPTITQAVHVCAAHKKTAKLLKHLAAVNASASTARHRPRVAVFVNRIATATAVAAAVGAAGHKVALLHGGRPQAARDAALTSFRAGAASVLVATDVAARGLHIPTLRHVVNYDFPPNLETYTHRIGRAGRLEDGGHAFSFFTRPLAPLARPLLALLDAAGAAVDPNLVRLADSYDEARAQVARLPDIAGGGEGDEDEKDAARAARRAAIGQVLAGVGGDKKRSKKKKVAVREEKEEVPSDDGDSDSAEEEDEEGDEAEEVGDAPPARKRKAKPLAKADLPGLYKTARSAPPLAGGGGGSDDGGGGGEDDDDGPPAWTLVTAKPSAAPSSDKRRKALPGRLRKKQAAERAKQGGGGEKH